MSSCLSRPGWEMTLSYIFSQIEFGFPDNLLRPSIMWRVLLYWAGIDRNLHSIGKRNDHQCNVNVLSFCFSAYCNALFYCCGISIISLGPWWNLSSEFQTIMVPGCQHEDSDPWDPCIRQVVKQMLATKNVSSWGSSSSGYAEDLADLELGLDIFSDTSACGRAGDGLERCSIQ